MNTQSKLKINRSGGHDYLIIYFKKGRDMLRIPTGEEVIKGKMTANLLFTAKVEDYQSKNKKILNLKSKVDAYILIQSRSSHPRYTNKDCIKFIQHGINQFGRGNDKYNRITALADKFTKNDKDDAGEDKKTLVQYIEEYIQYRKDRNTTRNTAKEFTTMMNRIKKFDLDKKKTTLLSDINFTWSDAFEKFLLKKNYNSGTIEKTYTILITVLNHLYIRKEELNLSLSDKFRLKGFKRGEKSRNMANPLTFEQFKTLYHFKFEEDYLEKTRIRFCLQCSTGLRYSDMHRIIPDMIHDDRIMIKPVKTEKHNITAEIDLNPYSREILSNLDFDTSDLKIENAPYNRNIKTMFQKIQKEKPDLKFRTDYGSHCARDTFISICVQSGIDFKTILTWTGQKSYSIMDRYISTTDEFKAGQMGKAFDR
ncbi:MAG: tyrosine-type recombinase/integrase [Bacteroidales bacterium]|nr:tyrosine-type recombinase/integrase [Bacteroidales bacterium]